MSTRLLGAGLALLLAGCGGEAERHDPAPAAGAPAADAGHAGAPGHAAPAVAAPTATPTTPPGSAAGGATAPVAGVDGAAVAGSVRLTPGAGGVAVAVDLTGLTPGDHGFHVHEKGDCSDPKGKSMGEHYAGGHAAHGAPGGPEAHAGDMGNVTADAEGRARVELTLAGRTVEELVGKAVIVHAGKDDLTTQPSGGSGDPVACGVIARDGAAPGGAPPGSAAPAPIGH